MKRRIKIKMASIQQWANHFKKVSPTKKAALQKALKVLESDKMIKKEFNWTGLFALDVAMRWK